MNPLIDEQNPNVDIVFFHGHRSYPVNCWRILNEQDPKDLSPNPQIWIKDFLYEDIKEFKPRIMYTNYETFNTKAEYYQNNVPELDFYELSQAVGKSLA